MQTAIISGNKEIIDLLFTINSRMDQQVQEATEKYLNQFAVIFENYEQNFNYVKSRIPVAKPEASTPNHELGQEFLTAISKPSMLKELLEKKVDINCTFMLGKFEVTPLYLALAFNNKTAIDMLIDAGASLSTLVTDETGCKKTVAEVIQAEIDKQNAGTIKSKERLRYALGKAGL